MNKKRQTVRKQCEKVGKKESSEKPRKKREAPTEQGSREDLALQHVSSMDSTGEKHIVLCIHFQYPAPKGQAGGDLWWDRAYRQPQAWGCLRPVPLQGPPLLPYALPFPIFPLCSNCPNLGILGSPEVQKRELPSQVSLLCTVPQLLPQGVV